MKKKCSIVLVLSLLLSVLVVPIYASNMANARWTNTSSVILTHEYYNGNAECYIAITGYTGAVITNVTISLDKVMGSSLVNIATWSNLSAENRFRFSEYVPGVEIDCIYRLSLTADVIIDGVVEHLDLYEDEFYTETE